MTYKSKIGIKTLIAAGVLTLNVSGCGREIHGYSNNIPENISIEEQENNIKNLSSEENEIDLIENEEIKELKEKLVRCFETNNLILDGTMDEFISSIVIDGTNVSIELSDRSDVSGTLYNLEISDITLENLYIYDSKYTQDLFATYNGKKYIDYKENGYEFAVDALKDDFDKHEKLDLKFNNCSVCNEYKKGNTKDIYLWNPNNKIKNLDYSACKKLWLYEAYLQEDEFSQMPNLETLILVNPQIIFLEDEEISFKSYSLKNIIIDGQTGIDYIDKFDFTMCPFLEKLSITAESQETNLEGLKGLNNLKQLSFGLPVCKFYDINALIYKDFQERIDMISEPFPVNHKGMTRDPNCFMQDISAINGSNIEVLNISFLNCISSEKLLETVESLPNLKEIVGFEVNNAGMCSDELFEYCEIHEIKHPFTQKSLGIKYKLKEIVSNVITEDMSEEEKIKVLSEYVVSHMEYDDDLIDDNNYDEEEIIKGWGECLYYSVMEEKGVCNGYTRYAQALFNEAGVESVKVQGIEHTWNVVQIDGEYYFVDLTNIDVIVNEEEAPSFDNYNLTPFYLLPMEKAVEFPDYARMLPIDAEKIYEEAWKKAIEEKSEDINEEEVKGYIIQIDRQNKNQYSNFCGIIGILCALGLAKKVTNKEMPVEEVKLKDKEGVIKAKSLKEIINILKRDEKLEILRNKRNEAKEERNINNQAKKLEIEASKMWKETNIR